jgi:diadenosine tetraphosphatase ApaH/serine/threonine PP2A family protein phosphatase
VVCFGHTHKPWHRTIGGVHFVNAGSVGRPKDGNWHAGYVLLDMGNDDPQVTTIRVPYDLETTMAAIRASDLPNEFAEYLRTGGRSTPAPAAPC